MCISATNVALPDLRGQRNDPPVWREGSLHFQPLCSRTTTVPGSSMNFTPVVDFRDVQTGP